MHEVKYQNAAACVVCKVTGQMLPINVLVRIGLSSVCDQLLELVRRIRALRLDASEYTCLKFVILLNPGNHFGECGHILGLQRAAVKGPRSRSLSSGIRWWMKKG